MSESASEDNGVCTYDLLIDISLFRVISILGGARRKCHVDLIKSIYVFRIKF